ncbi:MAG: ATP-dependent 6-phosphofructokinase [Candidatus Omnitrophica bacterium]|nr:ATP-dependent 6-phosphofructokinase [Candidatus Omnitrophota bacterium]
MDDVITMAEDLEIPTLGKCQVKSPLYSIMEWGGVSPKFVRDHEKVLFDPTSYQGHHRQKNKKALAVELAGPRSQIYFNPSKTKCAIVTCGGLCPGINDVIRAIVMAMFYRYGVRTILGVPYGYQGFIPEYGHPIRELRPQDVAHIHREGGNILGSSRGEQDPKRIVDFLVQNEIQILFVIGGDGTLRGALKITKEIERRNLKISIIGVPKTIDDDILYIDQSFGFETAFSEAVRSIISAHNEAHGVFNGVGLVKLMGRYSGFIACYAALAMNDVNFVLIPEVPFELYGEHGFLEVLRRRLAARKHAVIVVAEGAGQDLMGEEELGRDASGNLRLKDVGLFLREKILTYFKGKKVDINVKYIDPSYIIRSVPASPQDSVFCLRLAEYAVHAAMSGRTQMVVGKRNGFYVHLPMSLVATGRKRVNPDGFLWFSVLNATGQPVSFFNPPISKSNLKRIKRK